MTLSIHVVFFVTTMSRTGHQVCGQHIRLPGTHSFGGSGAAIVRYFLSIGVFVGKAANESKRNDQQIECHSPMTDVIKVILNTLRDGSVAAPTVHLGPPCDTHLQIMAAIVIAHRLHELLHQNRALPSWADNAHVALEHVEKLRQFVQACFSKHFANSSAPRIVLYCPTRITLCG